MLVALDCILCSLKIMLALLSLKHELIVAVQSYNFSTSPGGPIKAGESIVELPLELTTDPLLYCFVVGESGQAGVQNERPPL